MTHIPRQQPNDVLEQIAEWLARRGYALLTAETGSLLVSVEARLSIGAAVPLHELETILYAAYCGPFGDYHTAKVFA
jgi:hypothetical protein